MRIFADMYDKYIFIWNFVNYLLHTDLSFIVGTEKNESMFQENFEIFHDDKTIFVQFDSFSYLHLPSANIKRIP